MSERKYFNIQRGVYIFSKDSNKIKLQSKHEVKNNYPNAHMVLSSVSEAAIWCSQHN